MGTAGFNLVHVFYSKIVSDLCFVKHCFQSLVLPEEDPLGSKCCKKYDEVLCIRRLKKVVPRSRLPEIAKLLVVFYHSGLKTTIVASCSI